MSPDGLDWQPARPVGAGVVCGGSTLIGLVLFTETLLRVLVAMAWRGLRRTGARVAELRPSPAGPSITPAKPARTIVVEGVAGGSRFGWTARPGKWVAVAVRPIAAGFLWLRELHPVEGLRQWLSEIRFDRRRTSRVMPTTGPILRLEPVSTARRIPAPTERRAAVMPRPVAPESPVTEAIEPEVEEEGVAMERPLPQPVERRSERPPEPVQPEMNLFPNEFQLPSLSLLADPPSTRYVMSESEKEQLSRKIEQTLAQFKIEVEVIEVIQGPVITRFALKVAPGVRVNRILQLESELAMAMRAHHVRILAPIPGQSAVGVEVPNKNPNTVTLKELLATDEFQNHKSPLAFALGKNIAGEAVVCDLAQMPHLLIAGATGSGKSVCLNTIIASLLYRNKPDRIKFIMVDPKRVELSIYQAIPHLTAPVVTEPRKAAAALAWCVEQMEERYKRLAEVGVRNIDGYNALATSKEPNKKLMGRELKYMPHVVIIIDELADLMMVAKNEVEEYIIRLAQMARAVGMHLILATQRPSVNVITGIIKANFPSRIAFQVSSKVDSRTILDLNGAEALMGRGDMLYSPGGVKPFRLQGAFVSDAEVERLADYIREQEKVRYEKEDFEVKPTPAERAKAHRDIDDDGSGDEVDYDAGEGGPGPMAVRGRAGDAPLKPGDLESLSDEDLYEMALQLVLESRKASVSYIQRRMKIGYARAGRIMDLMEERGIVGPYQGSKPRELLVDPREYLQGGEGEE